MEIGPIIQGIRLEKGIPAKEVYEGILSRNNFYRFEKGQSSISVSKFLALLARLNVKLYEFNNLYNIRVVLKEQPEYLALYQQLPQFFSEKNIEGMKRVQRAVQKHYEETQLHSDLINNHMLTIWINDFSNSGKIDTEGQDSISYLYDYLTNIEAWSIFPISIFINLAPYLTNTQLQYLFNLPFNKHHDLTLDYSNDDVSFDYAYLSILESLLEKKDLKNFLEFLKVFLTLEIKETDIALNLGQQVFSLQKAVLEKSLTQENYQKKLLQLKNFLKTFQLKNAEIRVNQWHNSFLNALKEA